MNSFIQNAKLMAAVRVVLRQISMILIALILATIFLVATGYTPFAILQGLWLSMTNDIAGTIRWSAPLILAGLAVCVAYKAQIFNIGVDGQLYMGAAAATAVALYMPSGSSFLSLVCIFAAAMLAGMLFAMIPAALKVYLNTNEVVSTLLLNFVAALFIEYLVTGPMRDQSAGANLNASAVIPEVAWLPRLSYLQPSSANIGFYMALVAAIVLAFIFFKTTVGYEIKIVGSNDQFAKYGGIRPQKTTIQVMGISGAIAGIIGAVEVTAVQHRLMAGFNPGFGFDGIVVSLLANNNPLGVFFTGTFFGALRNGGSNMERMTEVPSAVTNIVMAIIILTISIQFVIPKIRRSTRKSSQNVQEG